MNINFNKFPFTLLCFVLIWFFSFFSPPHTKLDNVPFIDKWAHVAMYGGTCLVFWIEYRLRQHSMNALLLIVITILGPITMSGAIELLQEYCTNGRRSGDWLDFAANSLGVLLAAFAGRFVIPLFVNRRKKM